MKKNGNQKLCNLEKQFQKHVQFKAKGNLQEGISSHSPQLEAFKRKQDNRNPVVVAKKLGKRCNETISRIRTSRKSSRAEIKKDKTTFLQARYLAGFWKSIGGLQSKLSHKKELGKKLSENFEM